MTKKRRWIDSLDLKNYRTDESRSQCLGGAFYQLTLAAHNDDEASARAWVHSASARIVAMRRTLLDPGERVSRVSHPVNPRDAWGKAAIYVCAALHLEPHRMGFYLRDAECLLRVEWHAR